MRSARDVDDALEEVRSLARGIYPAPLADLGLVEGLRAAALSCALPTTVLAAGVGRYPRAIESAAYFCCLEALQNAAKHASGRPRRSSSCPTAGSCRFAVRDDGAGFDPAVVNGGGVGFTSMRDRLAAVGGDVEIVSRPGHGTRVSARIPLAGGVVSVRRGGSARPRCRSDMPFRRFVPADDQVKRSSAARAWTAASVSSEPDRARSASRAARLTGPP